MKIFSVCYRILLCCLILNSMCLYAGRTSTIISEFQSFTPLKISAYGDEFDAEAMSLGSYRYLGNLRNTHEITMDAQGFFRYQGKLLQTDTSWRWIMDMDGKLYGLPIFGDTDLYHSSLVANEWPFCAGVLKAKGGSITYLSNHSGHFKPNNERLKAVWRYFKRSQAKVKPNSVKYVSNNNFTDDSIERTNIENYESYRRELVANTDEKAAYLFFDSKSPPLQTYQGELANNYQKLLEGRYVPSVSNRELYKVTLDQDGYLIQQGKKLHSLNGENMKWIIEHDGSMYAVSSTEADITHYSLMGDTWPAAAGDMKLNQGMITSLTAFNNSFESKISLSEASNYLKSQGVMMDFNTGHKPIDEPMYNETVVEPITFLDDPQPLHPFSRMPSRSKTSYYPQQFQQEFMSGKYEKNTTQSCSIL